jgi:hypothetical protein
LFNELKHGNGSRLYAAAVHRRCKASGRPSPSWYPSSATVRVLPPSDKTR